MEPEILFARHERAGVAWAELTLNRPLKGNALTLAMLDDIEAHVKNVAADPAIRVLVIRGAGKYFCTGGDITAWGSLSPGAMAQKWIHRGIDVIDRIAAAQARTTKTRERNGRCMGNDGENFGRRTVRRRARAGERLRGCSARG